MTTLLLVALAAAIWLARRSRSLSARWRAAGWAAVAAMVVLAAALAPPLVVSRKLVGFVLMPATLVWVAILILVMRSWAEPRWRFPLLALLVAYTLAGSPWTSYLLLRSLERPFEDVHPLSRDDRYEAVLVLGGGTSSLPHGEEEDYQLSPEWQAELRKRMENADLHPELGQPWDIVKAELQKKLKCTP